MSSVQSVAGHPMDATRRASGDGSRRSIHRFDSNVGAGERAASLLAGSALEVYAVRTGGFLGGCAAALGLVLLVHGGKRHCALYGALNIDAEDSGAASHPLGRAVHIRRSITVGASAQEAYAFWRDPSNIARVADGEGRIEAVDEDRWRWTSRLPVVGEHTWEAQVIEDRPGERLAWACGDDVASVSFRALPDDRGTVVSVETRYHAPAGAIGAAVMAALGKDPASVAARLLRRFKQLIETGEIATAVSTPARD